MLTRHTRAELSLGIIFFILANPVSANIRSIVHKLDIEQKTAYSFQESDFSQLYLKIQPQTNLKWDGGWSLDFDWRVEASGKSTGLGSRLTYNDLSRPIKLSSDLRIEIDKATVNYRKRSTRITLGKQVFAWGVLDGFQVTDRLDAIRRREAVFIENRPDRISRWSMRAQFKQLGLKWDFALIPDATGDQLAQLGDFFATTAPRFRAAQPLSLVSSAGISVNVASDTTFGIKTGKSLGQSDVELMIIQGTDTEPLIVFDDAQIGLAYRSRVLYGTTFETNDGPRIWRFEAAYVPNQSVNINQLNNPFAIEDRERMTAGIGLDYDLPNSIFLNFQLAVDYVEGEMLYRQSTDLISTVKYRQAFSNDTWVFSTELLMELNNKDGTLRPSISWQATDFLLFKAGVDFIWGSEEGIFGQFNQNDRVWLATQVSI